jgi:hypothetical protein
MSKAKTELKDRVASFRIPSAIDAEIEVRIKDKIVNCSSANKFYRKLALDWFYGRLVYTNPKDFNVDPDVAAALQVMQSAQPPASKD